MILSHPVRLLGAVAAGLALAIATIGTASAHVTIDEHEVVAGESAIVTLAVMHGCDGSPTTAVRIQLPESIATVTPTVNPGWTADMVTEALDEPIVGPHGEQLTERISEVVYTAVTPLADGYRDTFELSIDVPAEAVGQMLYFPTIQTCEAGETAWIEIPSAGSEGDDLDAPAPGVLVVAGSAGTTADPAPILPDDACSLVPDAEAAAATGLPIGAGVPGGDERRRVCTFQSDDGSVGITIGVEAGGRFDEKAEASRQALGEDGEDVAGLGDDALFFYSDDDLPEGVGGVLVAVGDLTVDVTMQGLDEDTIRDASVALATLAVGNL